MSECPAERWQLVRGADIQPSLRLTLYALNCFQGNNATAFCKRETLADEVGVHVDQLSRKLQALEKLGVIKSTWTKRNDRPSREHSIDFDQLRRMQRSTLMNSSDMNIHRTSKNNLGNGAALPDAPKSKFRKPTAQEVKSYAQERSAPSFDAEKFCDYYEANGWRVGKSPMKDWQGTVRNWIRNDNAGKPTGPDAQQLWQTIEKAAHDHRFDLETFRAAIGPDAANALKSANITAKQIDEAAEFDRRQMLKRFIQALSQQRATA